MDAKIDGNRANVLVGACDAFRLLLDLASNSIKVNKLCPFLVQKLSIF